MSGKEREQLENNELDKDGDEVTCVSLLKWMWRNWTVITIYQLVFLEEVVMWPTVVWRHIRFSRLTYVIYEVAAIIVCLFLSLALYV